MLFLPNSINQPKINNKKKLSYVYYYCNNYYKKQSFAIIGGWTKISYCFHQGLAVKVSTVNDALLTRKASNGGRLGRGGNLYCPAMFPDVQLSASASPPPPPSPSPTPIGQSHSLSPRNLPSGLQLNSSPCFCSRSFWSYPVFLRPRVPPVGGHVKNSIRPVRINLIGARIAGIKYSSVFYKVSFDASFDARCTGKKNQSI